MKRSVSVILSFLLGVLLVGPLAAAPAVGSPDCSETATWVSAPVDSGDSEFGGSITDVRAGRHECYDRLVVDASGAAGDFTVGYVGPIDIGPTEEVVLLRGGAHLLVRAQAGVFDGDINNPTYRPPDWAEAVDVSGFRTFRQLAVIPGYEETRIGLGVRERLPFRASTLDGPGDGSRLVVDVAHSWQGQGSPSASPFGNYESARGVEGGVEVKGWTIDPERTDPIYVWVTVDGAGRHLHANVNRPDVGTVYPAYGPDHGFRGVVPASSGSHVVCVTSSNVGLGGPTPLGCRTVTVPSASPFGNFESATGVVGGIEVKGWMADPSDPATPLYAWVTIDGVGRHLLANKNRPDVAAALPGYGPNHGFRDTLPASPGSHRVCVTAANAGPGNHTSLGCRTETVPDASPFGNYESARAVVGGIEVTGWAIDPDTSAPIYVWVTVDGVGRHLHANRNRPDVAAVYPAYGPDHGSRGTVPASPGNHTVCVTASNVGAGTHTHLGCRTVTVPSSSLTVGPKRCDGPSGQAGTVTDIRFAQREGFTRVVFDFSGEVPGCWVTDEWDSRSIDVIAWFVDTGSPYVPGIFDGAGSLPVNTTSVESVWAGQMSGGSGEWRFRINLAVPDRPFYAFALGDTSRVVVDISD